MPQLSDRTLFVVFWIAAVVYTCLTPFSPYSGSYLIKIIPILCMATYVWRRRHFPRAYAMFVALLFAAVGDVFLDLPGEQNFLYGLIAFLIEQVLYAFAFLNKLKYSRTKLMAATGVVAYSTCYLLLLWPRLNDWLMPVTAYVFAITFMGICASLRAPFSKKVALGAYSLIISDSIIAYTMFIDPIPQSNALIISTYYLGQWFVATGFVRSFEEQPTSA